MYVHQDFLARCHLVILCECCSVLQRCKVAKCCVVLQCVVVCCSQVQSVTVSYTISG